MVDSFIGNLILESDSLNKNSSLSNRKNCFASSFRKFAIAQLQLSNVAHTSFRVRLRSEFLVHCLINRIIPNIGIGIVDYRSR